MGGGVHLDLIHEIDYCKWLFGMPDKTTIVFRNVSTLGIDAMDFAHYEFLYKRFTANITLNYYRRDGKREIEIVTNNETIVVDLIKNTVLAKVSGIQLFSGILDMSQPSTSQMH